MLFLAALVVFSACDNWNIPVKERIEFYTSVTPVSSWEELGNMVTYSDAAVLALAHDVVADSSITITRTLTIVAFEGTRTISRATAYRYQMFEVLPGGDLTLGHPQGGTLILDGGATTGVTADLVLVEVNKAKLTIRDGAILRNNDNTGNGGAVWVYGDVSGDAEMIMTGGTISGNTATGGGGGVYVEANGTSIRRATFTMTGGSISENTAANSRGGGVYVRGNGGTTTLNMRGGIISGNKATGTDGNGGGVYVFYSGELTMTGGIISGNTASGGNGGGVYVNDNNGGKFSKNSGGVIYGGTGLDPEPKNTASAGHAVYVYVDSSTFKKRDATVPEGEELDSSIGSSGSGGWE
jgi:hypothetical protein